MIYKRIIIVEVPSCEYFKEELGWEVYDKQDVRDYLDEMWEKEFYHRDENPFICDVESFSEIK